MWTQTPVPLPDFPRQPLDFKPCSSSATFTTLSLDLDHTLCPSLIHLVAATALAIDLHAGGGQGEPEDGGGVMFDVCDDGKLVRRADVMWRARGTVREVLESAGDIHWRRVTANDERARVVLLLGDPAFPPPLSHDYLLKISHEGPTITANFDPLALEPLLASWFLQHLRSALSFLASSPVSAPLKTLSFVTPEEVADLNLYSQGPPERVKAAEEAYAGCETLPDLIRWAAARYREHEALVWADPLSHSDESTFVSLTYAQLISLAARLASRFEIYTPGEVVALHMPKHVLMPVAMLAVSLAGGAYVNLEPDLPAERKRVMVMVAKAKWLVVVDDVRRKERWMGDDCKVINASIVLGDLSSPPHPPSSPPFALKPTPESTAYIIFTSGSTGTPKGIRITHRNVVAFLRSYRGRFQRRPGESRVLQFASYAFDVVVMNVWDTFVHGATLCMAPQESLLSSLPETLALHHCTSADLTPTVASLLLDTASESEWRSSPLKLLSHLNTGAEPVPNWIRKAFLKRGVGVLVDYGPSETTVGVASGLMRPGDEVGHAPDVGRPTGTNRVYLLDAEGKRVPLGAVGEICIAGDQVSPGYLDPALDAVNFVLLEDPRRTGKNEIVYRTGDLGRYLPDGSEGPGSIECLGRRDGQVKVSGLRIEVGEIENRLNDVGGCVSGDERIRNAVVDKLERADLPPGLVAFFELSSIPAAHRSMLVVALPVDDDSLSQITTAARNRLAETLPSYMTPRYWLPVNRIPTLDSTGKTDRRALRALSEGFNFRGPVVASKEASRRGSREASVAGKGSSQVNETAVVYRGLGQGRDECEDAVKRAWSEVLKVGLGELGKADEFVRLGGDSLGVAKVVRALRAQRFFVDFANFWRARTLEECVEVTRRACRASATGIRKASPSSFNDDVDRAYVPFGLVGSDREALLEEINANYGIPPELVEDLYPISPPQAQLLAPSFDTSLYYAQAVYSVHPSVSADVLAKALYTLANAREMLRTAFVVLEGRAVLQCVLQKKAVATKYCDIEEAYSVDDMERRIKDYLIQDRNANIFQWGRVHVAFRLFTLQGQRQFLTKLVWSMHHALSDGWTLDLLRDDLRLLCTGLPLPLRPAYPHFVRWWMGLQSSTANQEMQDFWRSYLGGAVVLDWPYRRRHQTSETSAVAKRSWSGCLSAIASSHGVTPALLSRVALALTVQIASDSRDVVFGMVRSGRDIELDGADAMSGCCVSVLPSRFRSLDDQQTVLDAFRAEVKVDASVLKHQHVTLAELARLLDYPDRPSLFRILFTYESPSSLPLSAGSQPVQEPPESVTMPTNYALSVEVTLTAEAGGLELRAYYDPGGLSQRECKDFLDTYASILTAMCKNPTSTVGMIRQKFTKQHRCLPDLSGHSVTQANDIPPVKGLRADVPTATIESLIMKLKPMWCCILQVDIEELEDEASFAALGGDSIATMRLCMQLKKAGFNISVADLGRFPTIRDQACWLAHRYGVTSHIDQPQNSTL